MLGRETAQLGYDRQCSVSIDAEAKSQPVRMVRHDRRVPRISEFYGIVIEMYFADHPPAHFHARYSGDEALIVIETGEVFAGSLPSRALRLVREWLDLHRDELVANWERASAGQPTERVAPLR